MFDFDFLLQSENIEFIKFLGRSQQEKRGVIEDSLCSMEIPLKNILLPSFTDQPLDALKLNDLEYGRDVEGQIVKEI